MIAPVATSEMGQLQTLFYLLLIMFFGVGFALFLIGVGVASLPPIFRRRDQRLLATLISAAFAVAFVFIVTTSVVAVYTVTHHG